MKRFTQIAGLSEARRLPRIGKLRLGVKVLSRGGKEIPRELDYFLLPDPAPEDPASAVESFARFRAAYGDKPRELDIVLPSEDPAAFFPQRFKCYGAAGLKCIGDGAAAERIGSALGKQGDEGAEFFELPCPTPDECEFAYEHGCKPVGSLFVILPKVSLGGCFQVDVSGINSILNVNSAIEHIRTLCGRVSGLIFRTEKGIRTALSLKRVPTRTQGGGHAAVHYPITLELRMSIDELVELVGKAIPSLPMTAQLPETSPPLAEQHKGKESKPETPGNGEPSIWTRIENGFVKLDVSAEERSSLLNQFADRPEELLELLRKRAVQR